MDKIPVKVLNFQEDEAIISKEELEKMLKEKAKHQISEIKFHTDMALQSILNSQMREKKKEKYHSLDFISNETPSNASERFKIGFSNSISHRSKSPDITAKARHTYEMYRAIKRMDKIWANRGLSVDRKSLGSDRTKDAFDMRNLSNALPSTSNHSFILHKKRIERIKERENRAANRLSSSETMSSEEDIFNRCLLQSRFGLSGSPCSHCTCMIERVRTVCMQTLQDDVSQEQERSSQPDFSRSLAKMSPDDKQEGSTVERQMLFMKQWTYVDPREILMDD